MLPPPFLLDEHPPHRIAADAVHPLGWRSDVANQIQAARHDLIEAEDRVDRSHFGMHVAEPHQAVAFDPIPEIFLHVQMHGISADLPDAIEPIVVAPEGANMRNVRITSTARTCSG